MVGSQRAQTSTLGVLFAVLLVLVTVTTVSVAALGTLGIEDPTFVGVSVEVSTEAVTVNAQGGKAVPASDLAILVGSAPAERYGVESLTTEETFEPGDSVRVDLPQPASFGDLLAVRVVYEPTDKSLFAERLVVRRATPAPAGLGRPVVTGTASTPTRTTTPTPTPTATPTATPTPTPSTPPSVEITDIGVNEAGQSDNVNDVDVSFVPDDPDSDLWTAEVRVYVGGVLAATESELGVSGREATTVSVTVDVPNSPKGDVEVGVVVTDAAGETGDDRESKFESQP